MTAFTGTQGNEALQGSTLDVDFFGLGGNGTIASANDFRSIVHGAELGRRLETRENPHRRLELV